MKKNNFKSVFDEENTTSSGKDVVSKDRKEVVSKGRKQTLFRVNPTAIKQLEFMAVESDKTRQTLLIEALNDLFRKYGKPPIA